MYSLQYAVRSSENNRWCLLQINSCKFRIYLQLTNVDSYQCQFMGFNLQRKTAVCMTALQGGAQING